MATLLAAIASDENAPGLLLRVYEDLRDRIARSRQTTYTEVAATVTSGLSTNIDQLETRVDSLNSECCSLRIRLAAAEDRVRDLESWPMSTAPLFNIPTPNSASGLSALPDTHLACEPRSHFPSRDIFADSDHTSYLDPNLSLQRVRRNAVPLIPSAPDNAEHHVIAPRHLRAVSPWRASNIHDATASVARTIIPSHAPTADSVISHQPCPRTRAPTHLSSAFRHRRLIRDFPTSRETNRTRSQRESRTSPYQAKTQETHPDAQAVQRYEPDQAPTLFRGVTTWVRCPRSPRSRRRP